jgi:hypothetical protein
MSLRVIPLLVIPFIIYNVVVLMGGDAQAANTLSKHIFSLPMVSGARWIFTVGDMIILLSMIMLFIELIKSTYTSSLQMVDHGLSMLVFIACLVEFLLVPKATSSVFFVILTATFIDVVAGAMIGIRAARRDLTMGSTD